MYLHTWYVQETDDDTRVPLRSQSFRHYAASVCAKKPSPVLGGGCNLHRNLIYIQMARQC